MTINGKDAVFYFFPHRLFENRYYRIYCLKHSRYAVKVITIPNPYKGSALTETAGKSPPFREEVKGGTAPGNVSSVSV